LEDNDRRTFLRAKENLRRRGGRCLHTKRFHFETNCILASACGERGRQTLLVENDDLRQAWIGPSCNRCQLIWSW
jgi:hypothetical protein